MFLWGLEDTWVCTSDEARIAMRRIVELFKKKFDEIRSFVVPLKEMN